VEKEACLAFRAIIVDFHLDDPTPYIEPIEPPSVYELLCGMGPKAIIEQRSISSTVDNFFRWYHPPANNICISDLMHRPRRINNIETR
jgi:hypothetical protein